MNPPHLILNSQSELAGFRPDLESAIKYADELAERNKGTEYSVYAPMYVVEQKEIVTHTKVAKHI